MPNLRSPFCLAQEVARRLGLGSLLQRPVPLGGQDLAEVGLTP